MQTIQVNIYEFDELTENAKEKAIEQVRQKRYGNEDIFNFWAIDDCYLFEPKHDELVELFGERYTKMDEPILGNTRKVYFDLDRNSHLDADEGIIVNNEEMFLAWLGIPKEIHEKVYFSIKDKGIRHPDTTIEFEPNDYEYEFTDEEEKILEDAIDKFENHMDDVLSNIRSAYEYEFTDEAIIKHIKNVEYTFTEDGAIYF